MAKSHDFFNQSECIISEQYSYANFFWHWVHVFLLKKIKSGLGWPLKNIRNYSWPRSWKNSSNEGHFHCMQITILNSIGSAVPSTLQFDQYWAIFGSLLILGDFWKNGQLLFQHLVILVHCYLLQFKGSTYPFSIDKQKWLWDLMA